MRYGYRRDDGGVEAVTLRVRASTPGAEVPPVALPAAVGPPPTTAAEVVHEGRTLQALRVWRRDLRPGHGLEGPALVLDYSATTWLPPGWTLAVDSFGILDLSPS
jgi:N-methylhydantoinase A